MANDGKIYITISDRRPTDENGQTKTPTDEAKGKDPVKGLGKKTGMVGITLAWGTALQIGSFTVNNIGNFTGNYQQQRDTAMAFNMANRIISVGVSTIMGAMAGGPAGAAIGFALSTIQNVVSSSIDLVQQNKLLMLQERRENYNISIMRQRLGLDGLKDGSRTGGY